MNNLFLKYFFISNCFIHGIKSELHGGVNQNIHAENIKNQLIGIPPLSEQTAIADFLDQKTGEIDLAVKKGEERIRLLKEYRAAVIHEAVTRGVPVDITGIDQGVEMKESGIEYIGEIPEHWEVKKLKYAIKNITGGGTPSKNNSSFWNGNIPWVSPKDMKINQITSTQDYITEEGLNNSSANLISKNSLLIVFRSGILKHTLPVAINLIEVALNQDMKAIEPNFDISTLYLKFMHLGLENEILTFCTTLGATVDSISMKFYMNFELPVPPIEEQRQIVEYIETETARLDAEIRTAEEEIRLLQEYREALISEAVTGKIDVRDYPLN